MLTAPDSDVVDRQIPRNPAGPRAESRLRIEPRSRFANSPEGLYCQVLRDASKELFIGDPPTDAL
jgi:hypothetical protein